MIRITIIICAAGLILLSCNDNKSDSKTATNDSTSTKMDSSKTDTSKMSQMNMPMDSAAMMKCWIAFMTPGDVHKMLAKSTGTWDEEVTMWMDPSKPPSKSKATAVNKMILGGRYQESHATGNFNGMPFEGISTLGYDNAKKILVTTWVDNMGTGIEFLQGTWDSTSHSVNFKGKVTDPMSGKDMDIRELFTMTDDNNQKIEMFSNEGGKEMKTMEIVLKRKK